MKTLISQHKFFSFISQDTRLAWLWLIVRLYLAWIWIEAGWDKVTSQAWVGSDAGAAISGFLNGALQKTSGDHPAVLGWWAWLIENIALPNAELFSYLIAFGEVAIGVALLLGILTAKAAALGGALNFSFMLSGSAGLNPVMFALQVLLVIAWRIAGWIGVDRWLLPKLTSKPLYKKYFES